MEGNDTINITVLIAGRTYPLKIQTSDEPAIRGIVKDLNEKISRFQLTYSKKDKQDCLSMALLTYAVDLHKSKQNTSSTAAEPDKELSTKIEQLDELLDHLLK
ncbi:MAG: cell division protein ZapA [Saprospiraceae bacterium]